LNVGESKPSHLCTTLPEDQPNQHPISGLIYRIEKLPLRADVLICCGDLGDKSRPAGIQYVWDRLHKIKHALGASELFITSGNHDVDSRYLYNDHDAKGVLQSLLPRYPLPDENLTNKYWSRNYAIVTRDDFRIAILNSSAYHGNKDAEMLHGRVSARTVEAMRVELEQLEATDKRNVNILLCHHHPIKYSDVGDLDYSEMDGAPKLIEVLGSGDYGNWMVIHGHRHQPRITYATGPSTAPVIFSAGSLSAVLYPELQLIARNQFYVIEFPVDEMGLHNLGLVGTFESWDWAAGLGWHRAGQQSGLPAFGGFGNKNTGAIIDAIDSLVHKRGEPWVIDWSDVKTEVPGVRHLLPADLETTIKKLSSDRGLNVVRDESGQPLQVGRKKS
jgi:predicted phosphodiesterase